MGAWKRPVRVPAGQEASMLLRLMMLGGMASLWILMLDWPEMDTGRCISCAIVLTAACAMSLARALSHRDADDAESWLFQARAAALCGMPLPPAGTPMGQKYRYGAMWLLFDMLSEAIAACGFLMCMPWGWFAILGRMAIRGVIGIAREMPSIKGDPESEDALEVAHAMSQATVAAAIVMAAWLSS